jgi:hypothetical protein
LAVALYIAQSALARNIISWAANDPSAWMLWLTCRPLVMSCTSRIARSRCSVGTPALPPRYLSISGWVSGFIQSR